MKCNLGTVSFAKATATVGVKVSREEVKLADMVKKFVDARVEVTLTHDPDGDDGQDTLVDTKKVFGSVADVHSVGVGATEYSFSLSFKKDEVPGEKLIEFSNVKNVEMKATRIGSTSEE